MKPKTPQKKIPQTRQERDCFQTPNYATDLIVPYLRNGVVWECVAGNGKIGMRLESFGFSVVSTDLQTGFNFLADTPEFQFDAIVTNPPFSIKHEFFKKCIDYQVPFGLLLPADFCGWVLRSMREFGLRWLIPTRRIDFITPTGKQGVDSRAQYHSGWLTYKIDLPEQVTVVELTNSDKENI